MSGTIRRALGLVLLSSATFAAKPGFYMGAGVGPESADIYQHVNLLVVPPGATGPDANVIDTTHLSGTGWLGTIFGGYAWTRQQLYVAGELNANVSTVEFKSKNLEFVHGTFARTAYKMENAWGISILPGFLYTPYTLFYGRVGYANGNFQISTTDPSLENTDRRLSGFRYGLGFQQLFNEHVGARMEYSHVNYKSTQINVVTGPANKQTRFSPATDQVEFAITYDFS